jgi:FkbM family methyltransferase
MNSLKTLARKLGYTVQRYAEPVDNPFSVITLIVESWLKTGQNCFFIQVGANDGVRSDPIRSVVLKHQLPGILVEPVPDIYQQLLENYKCNPNVRFESSAIGLQEGVLPFYRVNPDAGLPQWCQGIGSFDRNHLTQKFSDQKIADAIIEIAVPTITLAKLLEKHQVEKYHLLQVDVEGHDDYVVTAALESPYLPRIINYEFVHIPLHRRLELRALLKAKGYQFVDSGKDTTAVRCDSDWNPEG